MNIFIVSEDPEESAFLLCDQHVVKMTLESTQLLFTCHHLTSNDSTEWILRFQNETGLEPYKPSHQKHGCQIWIQQSTSNYRWLSTHALALCKAYHARYTDKPVLKVEPLLEWLHNNYPNIPEGPLTPPYLAMPTECQYLYPWDDIEESEENFMKRTVKSYRLYYLVYKARFARYYYIEPPLWLKSHMTHIQTLTDAQYLATIPDESEMKKIMKKKPRKVPHGQSISRTRVKKELPIIKEEQFVEKPVNLRPMTRSFAKAMAGASQNAGKD
ncbi:hypothetical protein RCL1_006439 [Eukaryota sp. TZLM3-RCL]